MKTDKISEVLDLEPIEQQPSGLPTVYHENKQKSEDKQAEADVKFVRDNLYDLITSGHSAIDQMMSIADQSQHPRAYEVLATMIKTMVETNKDLLDIHKKKQEIKPKEKEDTNIVNNNLFVGSTNDILKLLKQNDESNK